MDITTFRWTFLKSQKAEKVSWGNYSMFQTYSGIDKFYA